MGQEGEYGSEYPGSQYSGTPESRLFHHILEVEDVFYESETECDEHGKEHSFFDGIYGRKGTGNDAEMLARLFDDSDDQIIEKNQLQCSEHYSGYSDSPV